MLVELFEHARQRTCSTRPIKVINVSQGERNDTGSYAHPPIYILRVYRWLLARTTLTVSSPPHSFFLSSFLPSCTNPGESLCCAGVIQLVQYTNLQSKGENQNHTGKF